MNQFIKPPYENVRHFKYENHKNNPVNLANVNGIEKMQLRYYPDNDGIAGISFLGTETESLEDGIVWVFNNKQERDDYFEAIENNTYGVKRNLDIVNDFYKNLKNKDNL